MQRYKYRRIPIDILLRYKYLRKQRRPQRQREPAVAPEGGVGGKADIQAALCCCERCNRRHSAECVSGVADLQAMCCERYDRRHSAECGRGAADTQTRSLKRSDRRHASGESGVADM